MNVKNDGTLAVKKPKRGIYALANAELELSPAKAKSDKIATTESVSETNASDEDEDESESENISYLFAISQRDGRNAFPISDEERYALPNHEGSVAATTKIFLESRKGRDLDPDKGNQPRQAGGTRRRRRAYVTRYERSADSSQRRAGIAAGDVGVPPE